MYIFMFSNVISDVYIYQNKIKQDRLTCLNALGIISYFQRSDFDSGTYPISAPMASTVALRRVVLKSTLSLRSFSSTTRALIEVGDRLPQLDVLVENSPGNKVNLSEQVTKGKALIIGVPAAFSMRVAPLSGLRGLIICHRPVMLRVSCPRIRQAY